MLAAGKIHSKMSHDWNFYGRLRRILASISAKHSAKLFPQ
jgi:hypothetical protein